MEETFSDMSKLISNVENEINVLSKGSKKVIIYTNENDNLMYGLMNNDINQVCKDKCSLHNIMPSPYPSLIKLCDNDELIKDKSIPMKICNGNGEVFYMKMVSYLEYLKMYVKELKNSYNEINVVVTQ